MGTRGHAVAAGVALVVGLLVGGVTSAAVAVDPARVAATASPCADRPLACDVDGDGVADLVEEAICGSATCATGEEDVDGDGTPDAMTLSESLEEGGPGGPVQFPSFGEVLLVQPDGRLVSFSWLPIAVAVLVCALATAGAILVRRRSAR